MKSKDQILLEEVYSKILLNEEDKFQPNDAEMQDLSKVGMGEEYPEDEDPRNLDDDSDQDLSTYNGYYHYMIKTFGKDAISYARNYMEKDEYSDNLRMAFVGDPKTESLYNKIKDQGCCGYADNKEIPSNLTNGRKAYFGYNYGH
jgi:hypothetical protein